MAPLGLLSLAAYLEQEGHDVYLHDCLGPETPKGLGANTRIILGFAPDMVGFSTTTSSFLDGYQMAEVIKSERPEVQIVFGGVHVSALKTKILRDFAAIDHLCIGEGEATLAELAAGKNPGTINGLIWREGDAAANPPRVRIPDLDQLPFPAYEKLHGFPKRYNLPLFSYINTPGATMITSRGCPYQCSFCDRSVFKQSYRYNSAAYIYEHFRYLNRRFGVRHINIYDDLFTTHRDRITDLCGRLMSKPLGMNFNCAVRVGQTDDELLDMLKKAGCLQLSLGIETGDPDLLKIHKPGVDLEEVQKTVNRIQAKGMRAKGLFMMGLPGETETSIKKTSDFVMSLGLDDMNMSKFTPFPGAPIWSTIFEEGEVENDWRKMNCLNFVFVPREIGSKERLDELYNSHVKRFYNDWAWRKKLLGRLWEHRMSFIHMMRNLPDFVAAIREFEPSGC